jgi:hypothetical protein
MVSLHNGPAAAVKPPPRLIFGERLQRKLPALSPTFRALIGLELQTGVSAVTYTSPRQTAALTQVPMVFSRTIAAATPLELAAMRRGNFTVEALHKEQLANRHLTDGAVDKLVVEIGLDRVFAALERLTRPATNGAVVPNGHDPVLPANDNEGNGGAAVPMQLSLSL